MGTEVLKKRPFTLSHWDWSAYDKGRRDLERHDELLEKAKRDSLPYFITTMAEKKKGEKVTVRLETLELPSLRFEEAQASVSSDSEEVNHKEQSQKEGQAPPVRYEKEMDVEEIDRMVFNELGLKNLKKKSHDSPIEGKGVMYNDIRKAKTITNLNNSQTLMENMKRNFMEHGRLEIAGITPEDYVVLVDTPERINCRKAKVYLLRDCSGSMKEYKDNMRIISGWSLKFLKEKYGEGVDVVYVLHHMDAKKAEEQEFKTRIAGGGTKCSSALKLVNEDLPRIDSSEDVYLLHFSDGDNQSFSEEEDRIIDDDPEYIENVQELLDKGITQFCFIKVGQDTERNNSLSNGLLNNIKDERFDLVRLEDSTKLVSSLKQIFPKGDGE